jgi:putative endonuclease
MDKWFMYVVRCSDGSLYAGVTKNLKRRVLEHNYGTRGAKYTRSRRPVEVVYEEECSDHSDALKKEWAFKKLSKTRKERRVAESKNK